MDILSKLLDRGCLHLLFKILSSLDSWDLEVVGNVCHTWRQIVQRFFWSNRIVRYHVARNKSQGVSRHDHMSFIHMGEILGCGVVGGSMDARKLHSNMYRIWFLHSKLKEEKKEYFIEEWILFQNLSRIKHCRVLDPKEDKSISCCDFKNDILALGTEEGSVDIYQLNSETQTASCISVIHTHSKAVLKIVMSDSMMVSCSHDCSLTVVKFLDSGSLLVSHVLQVKINQVSNF